MIIPSIDLRGGETVQLIGGKEHALSAGDPRPLAKKFALAGQIAVIDLDAAMGSGSNQELIRGLLDIAPCRVGGGIRSAEDAIKWLDAGAEKVILGTKAVPDVLKKLPAKRIIAALDMYQGEVVVEGWQQKTGARFAESLEAIAPWVSGVMVTFVEREGRLHGIDLDEVRRVKELCGDLELTVAGGVTTLEELAALDEMGVDAQVGMALYTNRLSLAEAIVAPLLLKQPEALWPTVVCDEQGVALGLCYSSRASVIEAVDSQTGVYQSRKRGLWHKGATSGATQELLRVDLDCDRDTLRFTVRQRPPGFCHQETYTCWGDRPGELEHLESLLLARLSDSEVQSYTKRLYGDPHLLSAKLHEEVNELLGTDSPENAAWETADVLYFTLVAMAKKGATLRDVEKELGKRAKRISRRSGDAKGQ